MRPAHKVPLFNNPLYDVRALHVFLLIMLMFAIKRVSEVSRPTGICEDLKKNLVEIFSWFTFVV
jgi:hypothetical protein